MAQSSQLIRLCLPLDLRLVPATCAFAGRYARTLGCDDGASAALERALEEGLRGTMSHRGVESLDLTFEASSHTLTIRIRDQGMPIDGTLACAHPAGLQVYLTDHSLDEVHFNYLGQQGNETVLVRCLDALPTGAVKPNPEPTPEVPKDLKYDVRRMRAEDALDVARCVYSAYGYSYPVEAVYVPSRLAAMNECQDMVTAVAATEGGVVFATASLEKGFGPQVVEAGLAATFPEYRGHGAANRMLDYLIEQAKALGYLGMSSWAVTAHPFSQKLASQAGLLDCSMVVGNAPASFRFKDMDQAPQRGSVVGFYRDLAGGKTDVPLYPPLSHRAVVEELVRGLGWTPRFPEGVVADRPERSELLIRANQQRAGAILTLKTAGQDALATLRQSHSHLVETGMVEFLLFLDLGDPGTAQLSDQLKELGFFFGGILPRTACGDALVLQCLMGVRLDYDQIQVLTDRGKALKNYVRSCDPNQ